MYSSLLIHIKYNTNYNFIKKLFFNIIYCFFIFFFLVRIDILNSIHSFNSVKLSKNYFYIFFFILLMYNYNYFNKCLIFMKKFSKNFFIKIKQFYILYIINIFIYYINYNLLTTYLFNTQFIEITKYIKFFFILLINILILYIVKINKIILIILLILTIYKLYFIIFINLIFLINYFYKKYNNNILFHYLIIFYILDSNLFLNLNLSYFNYDSFYKNVKLLNNNVLLIHDFNNFIGNYFYLNNFNFFSIYFFEINNSNIFIKNNVFIMIYNFIKSSFFSI